MQKRCTYYYCPVKSRCGCEKRGGVFCQPPHNVGVFSSSRQKKQEAALPRFFSPHAFCLIIHWKQFWRNSLVLAVNYVDFL